jgi:hypothetical protein
LVHRLRTNPRDGQIGQNYFSNHFHAGARNPAGSKLLRRFVRANGARSASYERDYKALTGRRYNHLNLGEDEQPDGRVSVGIDAFAYSMSMYVVWTTGLRCSELLLNTIAHWR